MGRRGRELSSQMRASICKLRSLEWSYDRIHQKHPEIPRSIIGDACRNEANRLNNVTRPRSGALRVIMKDERDALIKTITLTVDIT